MDAQLQELSDRIDRIAADVTASVTAAVNEHVTHVVTAAEKRLSEQAQINAEAVKESARTVADAYGSALEAIERRLDRFEKSGTDKLSDHDNVLKNHDTRITRLERRRHGL